MPMGHACMKRLMHHKATPTVLLPLLCLHRAWQYTVRSYRTGSSLKNILFLQLSAHKVLSRVLLILFVHRAIAVGGRHSRFVELVARAGSKPAISDTEAFSFWIANLIPLNSSDKYKLLSMTSSMDRLQFEHEKLKGSSPGVCCIM